jgi:acetyl-CoA synthetase
MTDYPPLCVLARDTAYERLVSEFRWHVPDRYNIAHDVCDRWADAEPDRTAIIAKHPATGALTNISYGELQTQSSQLAHALARLGIERGDRVGLLLPQRPETVISHLALYRLGAIAVPLALLFGPEALEYRLGNCQAKGLIATAGGVDKIAPLMNRLPALECMLSVDGAHGAALDLWREIASEPDSFDTVDTGAEDPAFMVYTSGTTGPPKGALHAHRALIGHLPGVEFTHEFLPQPDDVFWTPSDWAWAGGLLDVLLPGLRYGVPVVACQFAKFDPHAAFAAMAECCITNAFIAPTALKMLRQVKKPASRYDLKLRTLGSGGEALGRETYDWGLAELGVAINEFYGQTECNWVLSSCGALGISSPGAIGRPVPGHEVAVIDQSGTPLPPGDTGEIAVHAPDPVMFLQYWGKPEATRDKYVGDWLKTGDQGYRDDDGYFHFVGRDDDVITSAGYRIGPGEIEDCLLAHDAVALAAAIGKPDIARTEIVKAFVVLNDGYVPDEDLEAELRDFVRQRLSAHEYPREFAFVDALPLTTTGKVIRRLLREQA